MMTPDDLLKLRELTLLLDLAYVHYYGSANEGAQPPRRITTAEGTVRLEFGSNAWRAKPENQSTAPDEGPTIESVVIYSAVFTAARVTYFDTLDDAITAAQGWYQHAKARAA